MIFSCFCLFDHYFHQLIKEQRYTTKKYRKRKKHGKGYQQKCLSSIQSLARGQFTTHYEKKINGLDKKILLKFKAGVKIQYLRIHIIL